MNNIFRVAVLVCSISVLASCVVSKQQPYSCSTYAWEQLAYESGLQGIAQPKVTTAYRESCDKQAVVLSVEAYEAANQRGLANYCKNNDPYELGLNGRTYHGACDQEFKEQFLAGSKLYRLKKQLNTEDRGIPEFNNAHSPRIIDR